MATVIRIRYWWLYRKRSEQSFPPHSEAARMPTNLASQVSGQASLTEDGLARTRAYCAESSEVAVTGANGGPVQTVSATVEIPANDPIEAARVYQKLMSGDG
jgi:hypothetical protein